jgi:signal transduction histidine kinase/ActR/RegA family two-component response regulator
MSDAAPARLSTRATAGPLKRLLALRLVAVAIVALATLAAVLAFVYTQLHARSAQLRLAETLRHYEARTLALDESWLREADILRAQIEFGRLLDGDDDVMRSARLTAFLTSLGGRGAFTHLTLRDSTGRVLFGDGPSLPIGQPGGRQPQLDWVYRTDQHALYRSVRLPVRIAQARGELLLLAPVDNALLGAQIAPDTALSLRWADQEVATSAYGVATALRVTQGDLQHTEGRIRWAGSDPAGPELHVVRSFALPINAAELLVIVAAAGVVAVVLGWAVFGRWLGRHVWRLTVLEQATTEFSTTRVLTSALERRVDESIQGAADEVHRLGDGLRALMRAVTASDAAQQRAQRALRELNLHLEERVEQRTHELAEARDAALAAARAKAQFLANMSHELRTPLSGLLGGLELMREHERAEEPQRLLEVARQSGKALLAVINDVLDYSKIEAGKFELRAQAFRPDELISEVTLLFAASAERKGLALRGRGESGVDAGWVEGDPMRLRQVLLNLVGNAVKFTDHGHIELRLRSTPAAGGQVELRFEVEDSGIGMDDAMQARLFEAFVQGDASDRRMRGGTGLGLAICQRLMHLMGGEIDVRSAAGQGSTFGVTLRLPRALQAGDEAAREAAQLPVVAGRVLLVEDNPVNCLVSVAMLKQIGLRVDECHNGAEAVEFLRTTAVDLVLMDCQMPVLDGFAATAQIRADEAASAGRRVPIIALTANALQGDAQRCRAAGMDGYVSKPFTQDELARAMAPWLGRGVSDPASGVAGPR